MREIKYRQILSTGEFHYWGFLKDGFIAPVTGLKSMEETLQDCERFTGLPDKNGVEIYEGDILATSNDGSDGADEWDKKSYGYSQVVWSEIHSRFWGLGWTWDTTIPCESVYGLQYVEVIGNFKQNPEPLK